MAKNLETQAAFDALINQTDTIVAVDFWAPWCGPCQAFGPILDEAEKAIGEDAQIVKVNVDVLPDVAKAYNITSIPAVLYFRNGTVVDRATGIEPADTIVSRIRTLGFQTV
ncbi:MAG: thioredoxin [Opitutaceae bacterium]